MQHFPLRVFSSPLPIPGVFNNLSLCITSVENWLHLVNGNFRVWGTLLTLFFLISASSNEHSNCISFRIHYVLVLSADLQLSHSFSRVYSFVESSVSHQRLCNQVLDQFLEFNRKGSIADREVRLQFFGCRDQAQVLRSYGSIGPKRKMTMESVHFPLLPGALGI